MADVNLILEVGSDSAAAAYAQQANASAQAAAASAESAAGSATAASGSATQAADSASAASGSATQASGYATAAGESASAAAQSATAAGTAKTNAENSASAAASSANSASSSASSASASATSAGNSATNAGTSATNAANSATAAGNSATAAGNSATAASGSATDAQNAKTAAQDAKTSAEAARDAAQGYAESANPNAKADVITNDASGAIASFTDGAKDMPVKSLAVSVEPVQSGSGDPSPDNIRPISGWTQAKVTRCVKNFFDKNNPLQLTGYITDQNKIEYGSQRKIVYIPCAPNTAYCASRNAVTTNERFAIGWTKVLPADGVQAYGVSQANASQTVGNRMTCTTTTGADAKYLVVWAYWANHTEAYDTLQIELGSSASDYEAYNGVTKPIDFGQTVYGGTLDVGSGVLTVDKAYVLYDGSEDENWALYGGQRLTAPATGYSAPSTSVADPKLICNALRTIAKNGQGSTTGVISGSDAASNRIMVNVGVSSVADLRTWLSTTNLQVVYPLATPVEVTLTAEEVTTLLGQNNIFADTGDVEVVYGADTKLYINNAIAAAIAAL